MRMRVRVRGHECRVPTRPGTRARRYNLGVARLFGYGVAADAAAAADWFGACGLPEGMHAVSLHHEASGRPEEARRWRDRARRLGFGTAWRRRAREATGSGGVAAVDLHSDWEAHVPPGSPTPPRW